MRADPWSERVLPPYGRASGLRGNGDRCVHTQLALRKCQPFHRLRRFKRRPCLTR